MGKIFTITEGLENMGALKTGGQGSVYKGKRIGEIITAIKLLPTPIHNESAEDKHFAAFQNEVNKLKKVNEQSNPNVVRILSSGVTETGNFPFIEMEYIDGPDLEELLKPPHDPVFSIKETIKLAEQLSNALAHCHKVEVKHGDIKSNNVKFNAYSGNYILLDFGLAVMSDEQRRTSLRHAGAVEFMAPEQNEGKMLFQTDVYSFGVILFELLAGTVPFPLKDKGETARNTVMISHIETPVPDLLSLRRQHLPQHWTDEKKNAEMHVPGWLIRIVYKCLEKKPEDRFVNGIELYNYFILNSTSSFNKTESISKELIFLQEQNEKLRSEKEQLQQTLLKYQDKNSPKAFENTRNENFQNRKGNPIKKGIMSLAKWSLFFLLAAGLGFLVYALVKKRDASVQTAEQNPVSQPAKRTSIGQYKVLSSRAYFHNAPDKATRRSAYMVPSNDVVSALDEKNGFIYTEFTNNKGQVSKGWVQKSDLITLEDWAKRDTSKQRVARLRQDDVTAQLKVADSLLANSQIQEALYIYSYLANQGVAEAMYQYGNLGLMKKNAEVDCSEAFNWVKKASDKGYIPAKRTLGFLYLFADNKEVLQINEYEQCQYERNVYKGSKLLMEAVTGGDTTAQRILDNIDIRTAKDSIEN